ncbi:hypothetical protein D047_1325B, partial [Vibrio parahaemolyticus VPTS-2010_2]
NDLCYIY